MRREKFLNSCRDGAACCAVRKGRSRAPEHDGESHIVGSELRKGVGSGFFEAGKTAAEYEANLVGGSVALLGDLDFRLIAFFGRGVHLRPVRTIDEHDHVGVLFDGAGFAEVGKLRAALFAFGGASELAEHENGDLQFFGEPLEAARDAGNFFLAIAEAAAAGDELKIIDNDERKAFFALEAAGFCADFEHAGRAGVVDPQRRGGNGAESFGHAAPVFTAEMAGTKFMGVNLRDRCDETLQQGFFGHFQAEESYRTAGADGNIFGKIESERGFSLRGAGSKNQQFRRLQAGKKFVEFGVAGGNAGDAFAFAKDFFETLEIVADDVFYRD